jgi:hypothetical protein
MNYFVYVFIKNNKIIIKLYSDEKECILSYPLNIKLKNIEFNISVFNESYCRLSLNINDLLKKDYHSLITNNELLTYKLDVLNDELKKRNEEFNILNEKFLILNTELDLLKNKFPSLKLDVISYVDFNKLGLVL